MDLQHGWNVVRRYAVLIGLLTLLTGLVALGITYVMAPTYVAGAAVLVRVGETQLYTITPRTAEPLPPFAPKTITDTHSSFFKTRALAEKVVQRLRLDQPQPSAGFWADLRQNLRHAQDVIVAVAKYGHYKQAPPYEQAVSAVQASLNPTPIKESYIILVQAIAPDPELAAAIANTAADLFVEQMQDIHASEAQRYRGFVEQQLLRAEGELRQAQITLRDVKQGNDIVALDEQIRQGVASRSQTTQALRDTTSQIEQSKISLARLRQQLESLSATTNSSIKSEAVESSNVSSNASSAQRNAENASTITGGTTNSKGNVVTTTQTSEPNPVHQGIQTELLSLEREIQALELRRDDLVRLMTTQRDLAQGMADTELKLSQPILAVTVANQQYLKLKTEYADALLSEARGAREIQIIDRGSPPLYPVRPIKGLFLLIGLAIGAIGGLLVAFGLDARQRASASRPEAATPPDSAEPVSQPTSPQPGEDGGHAYPTPA